MIFYTSNRDFRQENKSESIHLNDWRRKRKKKSTYTFSTILLTIILSGTSCLVVVKCLHEFKWHGCVWGCCLHWYHPYQQTSPICWELWAWNFSLKPDFFILAYVRNDNNEIFNVSQKLSPNYKLPLIFSSNSILKRNKQVYELGYLHMS